MRRLWARVVAKLEDNHARRTVMANARANAVTSLDWFPVAPPIPVETVGPPTDFDAGRPLFVPITEGSPASSGVWGWKPCPWGQGGNLA